MSASTFSVLFLCTGNSARSIMAESVMNQRAHGRVRAYSAGSFPTGKVNPFATELLAEKGCSTAQLRSKSWNEFAQSDAPKMDFVITVCDNAAHEVCPIWPGRPATAHWGFVDPAAVTGSDAEKRASFERIFNQITRRIDVFLSLPLEQMDEFALQQELRSIGLLDVTK